MVESCEDVGVVHVEGGGYLTSGLNHIEGLCVYLECDENCGHGHTKDHGEDHESCNYRIQVCDDGVENLSLHSEAYSGKVGDWWRDEKVFLLFCPSAHNLPYLTQFGQHEGGKACSEQQALDSIVSKREWQEVS